MLLTTVSSSPFRSCLACSLLSSCNLQEHHIHVIMLHTSSYMFIVTHFMFLCSCFRLYGELLREFLQLAALLLVQRFELLVLHPQPLLFQHDLLVQTAHISWAASAQSHTEFTEKKKMTMMLDLTPAARWSSSPLCPAHLSGCSFASGGSLFETGSASLRYPEPTRPFKLNLDAKIINNLQPEQPWKFAQNKPCCFHQKKHKIDLYIKTKENTKSWNEM